MEDIFDIKPTFSINYSAEPKGAVEFVVTDEKSELLKEAGDKIGRASCRERV